MTQTQLAGREFSKSFISLVERDFAAPSVKSLAVLAQRLGISLDMLVSGGGNVAQLVTGGLLALSEDARADRVQADQFLDTADRVARQYGLDDVLRETTIRRAQRALDRRAFDEAVGLIVAATAAAEAASDHWRLGRAQVLRAYVHLRQSEFPGALDKGAADCPCFDIIASFRKERT